ncbi:M36 family metallopeptidase [Marinicella litoralis]|uniref:Fungalysin/thermolysin propeptide n=1 Tax=Marinicella litoralis TaxID=644220 RepID=A0A4V3DIM1_9GAMM|nr:M36 family metallopeptidase [Marinicella litoralis]TDR22631.1 fungalysin/thermolysin propeptide [Marinicella litoralis]
MKIKTVMLATACGALLCASNTFASSAQLYPAEDARTLLVNQLSNLNVTNKDVQDAAITSHYLSEKNGISHLVFKQQLNGIEVHKGLIQLNLDQQGKILNLHNLFVNNLAAKAPQVSPFIAADQAILNAAQELGIVTRLPAYLINQSQSSNRAAVYLDEDISSAEIPVKLMYQKQGDELRLSWDLQIQSGGNWWSMRVDTLTGQVIDQVNWTADASYDVIPLPNESPADNGYQLETMVDPHDLTASPFGWHDIDGSAGAEFTDTRGNNVYAQDDLDANNSGGGRPDGGANLLFDVPWNPAVDPDEEQNLDAAIVNLFYWNNVIHDVMYFYGFDEAAGNFQENNYGNNGLGSDAVNADAQDGSGTNNANFSTPPDGSNPRMQMFYFSGTPDLLVHSPPAIAGSYTAAGASFGAPITSTPLNGIVEAADDNTGTVSDACEALVGFTSGRIALIDRGGCEFGVKVLNAENAGAIGAIVANNQGDSILNMGPGAQGANVTIPALMVGQTDGGIIRAQLDNNVDVDMVKTNADRDSDFDNGIIIHEYGHGISNRLTGGPSQSSCLTSSEQMGEGWSDFFALVMTADPNDTALEARPMGSYATQNPGGIRTYPYSTNMNVNLHTFGDLADANGSPHFVGSIWAQMLWEVYWNLVDKYGYDADLYNGSGGNNLALQLVMDGLKLQPCDPGFIDGRDAVLLADQNNSAGANQCEIWHGFAKRGLGVGASSGSVNVTGDETESYEVPVECEVSDVIFADSFDLVP